MGKHAHNFVKCHSCGHIGNTVAMQKCIICGRSLRRSLGFSRGIIAGGVTALSLGALALIFRAPIVSDSAQLPTDDLQQQASSVQETIEDGVTDSIDAVSSVLPDAPSDPLATDDEAVSADAGDAEAVNESTANIPDELAATTGDDTAGNTGISPDADGAAIDATSEGTGGSAELAQDFLSDGDRLLFSNATDASKEAGIAAYASGDYDAAIAHFEESRQARRNDPETLIYLNNAEVGDADAVYVAAVAPISSSPNSAQELLRGVAQLQLELNDSGTTLPMKVVVVDDANSSEQAELVAEGIVADDRILFVMGHGTSTTTLAAADIYQEAGLVMMAPTSTSTELSELDKADTNYIYRTIPSDDTSGAALATHVSDTMGLDSVVVFSNSDSSYSQSLTEAFTSAFESTGGVTETIDLAAGDPTDRLQEIDADAIALFPDADTYAQAIDVAKANASVLPLIAGDAMYSITSLNDAGDAVEGLVVPVPWHPEMDVAGVDEFATAAATLWGGDINWRTALSYDAMQAFSQALASGADSRDDIAVALSEPGFAVNGVTGLISFLSTGDRDSSLMLVEVVETPDESSSRSGVGLDFAPIDEN